MGKKAKKFKAFAAGLLALVMTVTSLAYGTVEAEAKQFTGSNFGVGFAGEEYATMHRADGWSNGGMFNCTWRAANIWFDGYLNIKIDRDRNGGYSAGEYRTNDTFGYGMYDVSFKAIKNPGVVTSFFTYTGPSDGTVWDEIDIEVLGKDTTKVQFNYYTKGQGNHEYLHNLGFDAAYGFHQYGFLWQPGRITWYVDGKAVHTATNNIPTTPGKIMMNVWPGTGVDEWLGRYNGVTPLVGSYDWINWKPVDNGSSNNNNNNNWNNNNNNNNNNSSSGLDGIYFIKNVHSGKYLDVANGSNANNTNIQQWDRNGHNAQKFKLVSAGNGYYYLYTGASGYSKVVDVAGRSSADGANVLQYSFSGASNQQFKLQRQSDGSYAILSRVSGDRSGLDVYNWSTSAGGNVCQWNFWGGACQKWILEKTW